nr:uncharacterized protein LOC4338198 isoform X3 [Oryza sativa Japonica Group]
MLPAALLPHLLIPPMMGRIASPLIPPKPGRITWPRSGRTPGTPMTSSPPMLWSTRCWSNASALLWSPPPRIRSPSPSLSRSWTYNEPLLAAILVSTAKSCSDLRRINLDGLRWCVFDAKGQVLGRLASQIAVVLQGKDKPTYAPHVENRDMVRYTLMLANTWIFS